MVSHNTQEKIPPARPAQIRRLLISLALIVLLVNAVAVPAFSRWSYNDSYWLMRFKWRKLMTIGKLDWLILGDSAGNSGMDAKLFTAEMGPSYNFCIYGDALIENDLDMLKAYVALHGAPRGVAMVHTYDVWHRVANPQVVAQTPIPLTKVADDYSAGQPSRVQFLVTCALERWVPLYAQPASFRQFVHKPHQLFAPRRDFDEFGYEANLHRLPGNFERTIEEHRKFTDGNHLRVSAVNDRAMREICELAQRDNFDVYFTFCPIYEGMFDYPAFRSYYDEVVTYLEHYEESYPRFHLLKPLPVTGPAADMQNVDHLMDPAARKFTQLVIDRIRSDQHTNGLALEGPASASAR